MEQDPNTQRFFHIFYKLNSAKANTLQTLSDPLDIYALLRHEIDDKLAKQDDKIIKVPDSPTR